jgi:hypothetical protein
MEEEKGISSEKSDFDKKQDQVVELPAVDFFKINFISFLVPLYACLAVFLVFEYGFIIFFSIPLFYHILLLSVVLLFLYYLYMILLIEFGCANGTGNLLPLKGYFEEYWMINKEKRVR